MNINTPLSNYLTHILFFFSGSVIGLKAEVMGITFYGLGSNVHLFLTWILLARKGYLNPVLSLALGLNILGMAFGKSIFFFINYNSWIIYFRPRPKPVENINQ